MRIGESNSSFPSIVEQCKELDPAVLRAQRMAELEQIAKYRAIKIQKYKDWSDPEKRAKIQEKYAQDLEAGKEELAKQMKEHPERFKNDREVRKLTDLIRISESKLIHPLQKKEEKQVKSLIARIGNWVKSI